MPPPPTCSTCTPQPQSRKRRSLSSLDQPHSERVHRFTSAAAHVGGRNLVIAEAFTWLRNHFHTALSHLKPEADRLLLCGIIGIHCHGTCYSPQNTEWPGWLLYVSTQVNARNPIFRDIPALNAFLARCQSILLHDDLSVLMRLAGVQRETLVDQGLRCIRRQLPDGIVYVLVNQSAKVVDEWVPVRAPGCAALLMDPMTGAVGIAWRSDAGIHLQLRPGESRILRVQAGGKVEASPAWPITKPCGEPFEVKGPWEIRFLEGGPLLSPPVRVEMLVSWALGDEAEARRFAGAACYSTWMPRTGLFRRPARLVRFD